MFDSEDELIAALMRKEDRAFRYAITEYQPSMGHLARSIAGEAIADEVVQEAWVSAMRALPNFEKRSALKTWLMRIVANEAKSRLRKEKRQTSLEAMTQSDRDLGARFDQRGHWGEEVPLAWNADSPEELISSTELKACMEALIAALPELQRATLSLRESHGYSLSEICNILDVSDSNVRVLLHRARNRLFRCIEHFQKYGECRTS